MDNRDRFIAFIDILGFRNLVLREPSLEDFCGRYRKVFLPLAKDIDRCSISHREFSDSLFVAVKNVDLDQELENLATFCCSLLTRSVEALLPIRGAISYGRVLWDDEVIVGPAIIEAVECQEVQEWIGIILAPSTARYLGRKPSLLSHLQSRGLIREYEVPVKPHPAIVSAWVIEMNWQSPQEEIARKKNQQLQEAVQNIALQAGYPGAELKCKNTIDFLQKGVKL